MTLNNFDDTIKHLVEAGDQVNASSLKSVRDQYFNDTFTQAVVNKDLETAKYIGDSAEETAAYLVKKIEDETKQSPIDAPQIVGKPVQKVQSPGQYADLMTCQPCGSVNLCPFNCCLDRCRDCPTMTLPDCEMVGYALEKNLTQEQRKEYDSKTFISWYQHSYTYTCTGPNCGEIPRDNPEKSVCPNCGHLPEAQRPKVKSTLEKLHHREPIGRFHRIFQQYIVDEYRQHRWLIVAGGTSQCVKDRDPDRLAKLNPKFIRIDRDYTDRIAMEINN